MARFTNAPVTPDAIKILEENRKKYADDWIDAGQVKFLLDGVIEAHTAAMLEPYEKDPSNRGLLYFDPEKYKESVIQLDRLGFPISTHAIGDRAIRLALDAYEAANKANGRTEVRDRIEHIEDPERTGHSSIWKTQRNRRHAAAARDAGSQQFWALGRKHRPSACTTRVSLAFHPDGRRPPELWQRLVAW